MSFVAGETVGPYRITEQLGSGGVATVFKAYHASLDRYAAIKVLHPAFKGDLGFLVRFQREARVAASWNIPISCRSTTSAITRASRTWSCAMLRVTR